MDNKAKTAERKLGEIIAGMPKAGGTRCQLDGKKPSGGTKTKPPDKSPTVITPTLAELALRGEAWQAERQRIADEGNRKRGEAAKERQRNDGGKFLTPEQRYLNWNQPVGGHSVPRPGKSSKAKASKTNPGAVARGDNLDKHRPAPAAPLASVATYLRCGVGTEY